MGTHPIFESDFDCLTVKIQTMTLESTVICVDNSEYCRNGDYAPTQLLAQRDAINMVARSKLKQNAENTCALLTMANNGLAATLTSDSAKLHSVLSRVEPGGEMKFGSAVRIAQLSLKHRMNKHHKQRIIMFICSPIDDEEKDVVKIAKKLKKEKVNIDIISFGEDESNNEKLAVFVNTLNGADGSSSHLVSIPANTSLSEALRKSPIIDDGASGQAGGAGFGGFEVDEAADPELAMALRISLEEQRARQQETGGQSQDNKPEAEQQSMDQDQQMLQDALLLSMGGGAPGGGGAAPAEQMDEDPSAGSGNLAAMTEEEQIALAIQMSMAESAPDETMEENTDSQLVTDPAFLQSVLRNLPGVDPDSEAVQEALGKKDEKKDEKK